MGLCLFTFDQDHEYGGVDVGPYAEFGNFRDAVAQELEGGWVGSKFPTLMLHSDCDGQWSPAEARDLERELLVITDEFRGRPPVSTASEWRGLVSGIYGLSFNTLYDCFFDVNGEPLLERLVTLAKLSQQHNIPITFQ